MYLQRPLPIWFENVLKSAAAVKESSFDKFVNEVNMKLASEEIKYIYQVNNEQNTVGKKGVTFNKEYFIKSKNFMHSCIIE